MSGKELKNAHGSKKNKKSVGRELHKKAFLIFFCCSVAGARENVKRHGGGNEEEERRTREATVAKPYREPRLANDGGVASQK